MKNILTIQDSLENKISYYHLALFLITLPFDRFYSELVLISLVIHTCIHLSKTRIRNIFRWQTLVLASVFIMGIIGIVWSQDKAQAMKDAERQLAILILPLVLSATALDLGKYKKPLLIIFGITCAITVLYLYEEAIQVIIYNKLPISSILSSYFINHNFSEPIGIHATYLSLYIALSIAAFLYFLMEEENTPIIIIYTSIIAILLGGLLQLASRSVLIATISVIAVFPFFIQKGVKRTWFIVSSLCFSLFIIVIITRIGSYQKRYVAELREDLTQASVNNEILEPRLVRWQHVWKLAMHSPVAGYGSGSEKRLLKDMYFKNRLYNSFILELNAHNQYLSFLLKLGIAGLLIFLFTLYTGFIVAWRNRDMIFTSFILQISIVSFSENMLDVNKGIFFYSFFFSLFLFTGKPLPGLSRFGKKVDGLTVKQ